MFSVSVSYCQLLLLFVWCTTERIMTQGIMSAALFRALEARPKRNLDFPGSHVDEDGAVVYRSSDSGAGVGCDHACRVLRAAFVDAARVLAHTTPYSTHPCLCGNRLASPPSLLARSIEQLHLGANSLRQLPDSVCRLKTLRVLWLDYNCISGADAGLTGRSLVCRFLTGPSATGP